MTRFAQLLVGLVLFGAGLWLCLQAGLGVGPWDVLHGGLSEQLGTPFGRTSIVVSALVMVLVVALRVRPGIGSLINVLLIGTVIDVLLATDLLDGLDDGLIAVRVPVLLLGTATVAVGSAVYLGAHLGPGPRDGLMVAIAARAAWSIGLSRAVLELGVLVVGVVLGGPVGIGTVVFALGIGPAVQVAFRLLGQTPEGPTTMEAQ